MPRPVWVANLPVARVHTDPDKPSEEGGFPTGAFPSEIPCRSPKAMPREAQGLCHKGGDDTSRVFCTGTVAASGLFSALSWREEEVTRLMCWQQMICPLP